LGGALNLNNKTIKIKYFSYILNVIKSI